MFLTSQVVLSLTLEVVLACWLSQNNQNKVITILFFAQYFCRNKSSPIRTSYNNAFVARAFLSLDFAICLFPQFLTSMLPFPAISSKWWSRFHSETVFFSTSSPQNRSSAHCVLLFPQFGGDLKMVFAERREFSEGVFRPCFPKSLAGKTL